MVYFLIFIHMFQCQTILQNDFYEDQNLA